MDERTKKLFKKYFYFFKTPHFVPKKWVKKIKKLVGSYFSLSDIYDSTKAVKDESLNNLNIDGITEVVTTETNYLNEITAEITADTEKAESLSDTFLEMLDTILSEQEAYPWADFTYEQARLGAK